MSARQFLALCLLAGGLSFGVGSAASWLLNRTASPAGGTSPPTFDALPELVAVKLDEATDSSEPSRTILVAKYEVTIADWNRCIAAGACTHAPLRRPNQDDDHPVTGVSWRDARQYVGWLSERSGRKVRLPKEREWDYLARDVVPKKVKKLWDDPRLAWAADYANFELREKKPTRPVGHFSRNRQGIYDLDGNVWEWTDSCVRSGRDGETGRTPKKCGGMRVIAGNHKTYQSEFVRDVPLAGCSIGYPPANLGFRVVLDDEPTMTQRGILRILLQGLRIQSV